MTVDLVKPRAVPYADAVRVFSSRARDDDGALRSLSPDRLSVQNISCNVVVGLNPCEREDRQLVHFDVDVSTTVAREPENAFDFRRLARDIRQEVESSEFVSLESLASLVARITLRHATQPDDVVTIRAAKPKALVFADAAEVEIVRTSHDYPAMTRIEDPAPGFGLDPPLDPSALGLLAQDGVSAPGSSSPQGQHFAAIALGSNLGDRFANIEAALQLLESPELISAFEEPEESKSLAVINTSFLYESAPMYVTDQPNFLNCACIIRTTVAPLKLLKVLKAIERTVGRVPSIRNGPRAVDLDVLFYDDAHIDTRPDSRRASLEDLEGHLVVPHPRMAEREFVLRPLFDMVPDFVHPAFRKPIHEMLSDVLKTAPVGSPAMIKVMPFPRYPRPPHHAPPVAHAPAIPHTQAYWKFPPTRSAAVPAGHNATSPRRRTRLMATLNVTPDSFSDGSDHTTLPAALDYAASSAAAGADIVDVGGYSTRPGAANVSPEEETRRVVPVIEAIRALPDDAAEDARAKGRRRAAAAAANANARDVLISVDTFRADVARSAVLAGANCINDVHAFTGPDCPPTAASARLASMKRVARELAVPVVLMHSRGDAGANKDYSAYGSVVRGVAQELGRKVEAIVRGPGGVRRWLVMVDPGIGFSKSVEGNLQLLRESASIVAADARTEDGAWNPLRGYPHLVGVSRKSFLGAILLQEDDEGPYQGRQTTPKERGWATAAAVACAVQQGAAVVRVHDVFELGDVVRVADAIWS
ncbi:Dihydropteroate synthase [Russula earlei]|uniref:Dihydropteroate synthase n=1 Tax=Russula earlei TaxID=71964 RepID=A0ACC0UQZ3_9AGAM|nr:Dihydropteroate synthase [Russula earlei]